MKLSRVLIKRAGDRPSGLCITDLNREFSLTNCQVAAAVNQLLSDWGLARQTILAFMQGGAPDALVWLAALAGGHELIPLSPDMSLPDVELVLESRQPSLIIGRPIAADNAWQASRQYHVRPLSQLLRSTVGDWSALSSASGNGQVLLSTSGSTGQPKQVLLSARQLLVSAYQIADVHALTTSDRGMTVLPLFHINAPVVSLLASLVSGGHVLLAKKHSSSRFWQWVERYQPTWISLVPAIATMLLQIDPPDQQVTRSVRFVRSASAPLAKATLVKFEQRFGLPLLETYGISEAAATITSNPLPPALHKAGSVGRPVTGIELRVCAPGAVADLGLETVGEVCVRGEAVIGHYEAGRGAESFQDGWFRTGDLGYFDQDGYLFLVGRSKDIIIRGGENIFPVDIESAILEHPDVREVTVVGKPDPVYGEAVVAFVCTSHTNAIYEQLQLYLERRLSPSQRPSEIRFMSTLPKNGSNKVNKIALREMAGYVRQ